MTATITPVAVHAERVTRLIRLSNAIANAKREQRPGRRGHAVDGWAANYCSIDIFEDDEMFVTERDGSFTRTVEVPAGATIPQIEKALDDADVYDY